MFSIAASAASAAAAHVDDDRQRRGMVPLSTASTQRKGVGKEHNMKRPTKTDLGQRSRTESHVQSTVQEIGIDEFSSTSSTSRTYSSEARRLTSWSSARTSKPEPIQRVGDQHQQKLAFMCISPMFSIATSAAAEAAACIEQDHYRRSSTTRRDPGTPKHVRDDTSAQRLSPGAEHGKFALEYCSEFSSENSQTRTRRPTGMLTSGMVMAPVRALTSRSNSSRKLLFTKQQPSRKPQHPSPFQLASSSSLTSPITPAPTPPHQKLVRSTSVGSLISLPSLATMHATDCYSESARSGGEGCGFSICDSGCTVEEEDDEDITSIGMNGETDDGEGTDRHLFTMPIRKPQHFSTPGSSSPAPAAEEKKSCTEGRVLDELAPRALPSAVALKQYLRWEGTQYTRGPEQSTFCMEADLQPNPTANPFQYCRPAPPTKLILSVDADQAPSIQTEPSADLLPAVQTPCRPLYGDTILVAPTRKNSPDLQLWAAQHKQQDGTRNSRCDPESSSLSSSEFSSPDAVGDARFTSGRSDRRCSNTKLKRSISDRK
eukprot:CAMPEP_0117008686 /NCGR_PEP_ID=MMETSP0472-20121206/8107_1 /TAXON_ID=693140 ORGANISM="Tiarina fusus, Strain LIS" /NCGR_SAMPLE_ID=MMETSP0472 /ASSEMBLY_ACC=CAM_ASM_000603 /LENGTH=543 /DNA_ID=CAMNT_0004710785 /DNA_START=117 /DNA_END=1748 /DNA_ORIENTATION=-